MKGTVQGTKTNFFFCFEGSQAMPVHSSGRGAFMMWTLLGTDERSSAGVILHMLGIYFDINLEGMH